MAEEPGSVEQPEEKEAKPAAKAAPAKPAGVKKPPAKPAAKPKDPLVDNGDGTITDPNTGLMWKQADAWLETKRFYTWMNHREYVDKMNKEKFAGYDNWRIPSKAEALSIHDKGKECIDKNGVEFFVDPIFKAGGAGNTWISECTEEKITRYDWKTGVDTVYPTKEVWASVWLVRKEGEAPPSPVGGEPTQPAETAEKTEAAAAQTETADAKQAPAAKPAAPKPKAEGGGKPGPTPRRDFTPEEKAVMLKRAKAHAAEVKARKGK